jgi:hypothetical protein
VSGCVPAGCTLPAQRQPARLARWGELFAATLVGATRAGPASMAFTLAASTGPDLAGVDAVASAARELARRESSCCSFFTFTVTVVGTAVLVEVGVTESRVDAMDWFGALAEPAASTDRGPDRSA